MFSNVSKYFAKSCVEPSIAPTDDGESMSPNIRKSNTPTTQDSSVSFDLDAVQIQNNWGDDVEIQNKLDMRLEEINRLRNERNAHDEVLEATVKALKTRAFHLPGNKTWSEDWRQYLANNHPFFGICCSSRLSPIGFGEKVVGMTISFLIAITLTNVALLWEILDEEGVGKTAFSFGVSEDGDPVNVSVALLILWTCISALHAVHDTLVWYVWCTQIKLGYILWLLLWTGAGIMMSALMSDQAGNDYDPVQVLTFTGIELAISWFFWYPTFATILFSGLLGCNRFAVLGGRPRQLQEREKEMENRIGTAPMNTMAALADYDASTMASKSVFQHY